MSSFTSIPEVFIIAPRGICETCRNFTGPKFTLSHLRGPSDIHRANIILYGSDRESVEASITSAYSEAAQLDEEISRLQSTLEILIKRRDALYSFAKQEEGLFSPIRKLPADVLRLIFLSAYPPGSSALICSDRSAFPRVVTQVSSYWRAVAHSCAPMWSVVYAMHYEKKFGRSYGELIQKCVTFSNQLPLKVVLHKGCTPSTIGSDCIRALGQCSDRWRSMTIWSAELTKDIFACIPEDISFCDLVSLNIRASVPIFIKPSPNLFQLTVTGIYDPKFSVTLDSAPSLEYITLRNLQYPLSTFIGVPWSLIKDFDASYVEYLPDEFKDVLTSMKNLVSLSLHNATDPESTWPITLPHLETLRLFANDETIALESLTAPSLKQLDLMYDFLSDFVVDFASRSKFSLEGFKIRAMEIDESWASPEFDTVKVLDWENPQAAGNGIEFLTNVDLPSLAEVFPRLEYLTISGLVVSDDEDEDWNVADIIRMLKSRITIRDEVSGSDDPAITGRYLKRAFISFSGYLSEEDIAQFKEFFDSDVVRVSRVDMKVVDNNESYVATI